MSIMMKCGCAANAKRKVGDDYVPCCTIHDTIEQTAMPDLTGRMAVCYCGEKSLRPSDPDKLAFFEYRGPGSNRATSQCKCGYAEMAHTPDKTHVMKTCAKKNGRSGFVPRGEFEYDSYYCGCRGWD